MLDGEWCVRVWIRLLAIVESVGIAEPVFDGAAAFPILPPLSADPRLADLRSTSIVGAHSTLIVGARAVQPDRAIPCLLNLSARAPLELQPHLPPLPLCRSYQVMICPLYLQRR